MLVATVLAPSVAAPSVGVSECTEIPEEEIPDDPIPPSPWSPIPDIVPEDPLPEELWSELTGLVQDLIDTVERVIGQVEDIIGGITSSQSNPISTLNDLINGGEDQARGTGNDAGGQASQQYNQTADQGNQEVGNAKGTIGQIDDEVNYCANAGAGFTLPTKIERTRELEEAKEGEATVTLWKVEVFIDGTPFSQEAIGVQEHTDPGIHEDPCVGYRSPATSCSPVEELGTFKDVIVEGPVLCVYRSQMEVFLNGDQLANLNNTRTVDTC